MDLERKSVSVELYNGEPTIRVTKTEKNFYEWATRASGMMNHSSKKEVIDYMERNSYEFYIVDYSERYNYESYYSI